jgi:type I restriction enzyme S subunit
VNGKYWPHNTTLYVTDFKNNDAKYVYYLLRTLGNLKTSDKSAVPGINRNDLHEVPVPYLSTEHQKKIAKVLSDLDAKIELNNRIKVELEGMAKLIYDYWFVQFDFPSAFDSAQAPGKPYKSSGGKMVWNEELKREVPEGWESKLIGDLLYKEERVEKIFNKDILQIGDIPVIDQSTEFISGFTNNTKAKIDGFKKPRIIFGDHTRILKLINFDFARGADGTQILVSNDDSIPQHLFYHSLMRIDLSNYGYARHFKFLKDFKIIKPSKDVGVQFENLISEFYKKIYLNLKQNQELSALRDWLLPMLMNGQVRVGEQVEKEYDLEEREIGMVAEDGGRYGL